MGGEVRVLVYHLTEHGDAVHAAYHEVSREMSEVPGMLGNELLRSVSDPGSFVVLSRWQDLESFQVWERGARHRDSTAALRPYQDTRMARPFAVLEVSASY
ncbi:antibiotic biosynthesis monooxygenase family protein [Nocardia acidivorans]|uniref:antibiotic biosynthesis monooxygenase family protein n=1 Tax=Nocardia acidivorans TaxID=404580 RepID=UPI00082C4653|nr:antibiotic biosynthesis monooxygenase family protein [Nocardia acidivorans]